MIRAWMKALRSQRLSGKISLLGAGSALMAAGALVVLAAWQSGQYNAVAQKEVDRLIEADLDHITQGIYRLVETENEAVQQQVNDNLNVARHVLEGAGEVSQSEERVVWTAVSQLDNARVEVQLPKMLVGGRWLGQNRDPAVRTAVVDEVTRLVGESATLFQRMNDRGDMLRVATTVRTAEGKRAMGTYIPAMDAAGTTNPVIAAVMRGEAYRGRAFVVDAWHLTAYEPVRDRAGELVGMLYVGFAQKRAESRVRQAIVQTQVGKTGYVYVLGGRAEERGRYIVSQRGERDGENIWESRDSDGQPVVEKIIRTARTLGPGERATERYRWQNPGEAASRWKVARLAYFEPWDWVIGTSVYEDELRAYATVLSDGRRSMTAVMGVVGLMIAGSIGMGGAFIARTIARPIRQMTAAAETITRGDLNQVVEVGSEDEIGTLARTFNFMTLRLRQTLDGLRQSEEEFRRLFENALEGIFQFTVEGRLMRANPGLARLLGYDSSAEMEKSLSDVDHQLYVHPEDREAAVSAILKQGSVLGHEFEFRRKDGGTIWVSLSARAVRDEGGRVLFIQGFVTDITARRQAEMERARLEEQFLQAQKMESVGRLAGGVAHDFNNMLQAILGNAALALEELPSDSPVRESLEEIQKSAQRSADLTRQLLAFARKQTISPRVLDLNGTITGMLKMLQRLIGEDVQLQWVPGVGLWPVRMDPSQVDQILANLVVNARDAIEGVGEVAIETRNVTLDGSPSNWRPERGAGDYVMLAVRDTGRGLAEEVKQHLFEPFFTTKGVGKGTGLGLATVFGIVTQNSGSIDVRSEPGQGTTFELFFPRAEVCADAGRVPATCRSVQGVETVLLVEDEAQILNLGRRMLERRGYTVLTAGTPAAAITLAEQHPGSIDVLVTDVVMPGMNGKELRERLLAKHPGLKCLFVSGYTADVIAYRGVLDQGLAFLPKPFTAETLAAKLRDVLEGV